MRIWVLNCTTGIGGFASHDFNSTELESIALFFGSGWGKIKHPGSAHHILQQAKMPPVNNSECSRKLATSPGTQMVHRLLFFSPLILLLVTDSFDRVLNVVDVPKITCPYKVNLSTDDRDVMPVHGEASRSAYESLLAG